MHRYESAQISFGIDHGEKMFGDLPGSIGSGGNRIAQFDRAQRANGMIFGHTLTVYVHELNLAGFAGSRAFCWFTMAT